RICGLLGEHGSKSVIILERIVDRIRVHPPNSQTDGERRRAGKADGDNKQPAKICLGMTNQNAPDPIRWNWSETYSKQLEYALMRNQNVWLRKCAPNNGRQLQHITGYPSLPMEVFVLRAANCPENQLPKLHQWF